MLFDGRSIVLAVAGVVGGSVVAAIAAAVATVPLPAGRQRGGGGHHRGGAVGLARCAGAAMVAAARTYVPELIDYFLLGVVVQLMQLTAFTRNSQPSYPSLSRLGCCWCLPLATTLLCMMFRNVEQQRMDRPAKGRMRTALEHAVCSGFMPKLTSRSSVWPSPPWTQGWIEVNAAMCATLGYPRDELLGLSWTELTHPDDLDADLTQFHRMLDGEIASYGMDKRFIHRDGHVVVHAQPSAMCA